MSKRAVLYARVSTDEQADKGYSLQTQLAAMREYAAREQFEIQEELTDDCSGSLPIQERPQGKRIYELVERSAIDAVVLFTHDRTARDELVIEYLLFKSYLYEHSVELHYSDAGLDPYTMEGNLVGYIKAHAATAERQKILERSMRGKHAKAQAGRWVGGKAHYGFRKEGKRNEARLVVDPFEADVYQRLFVWYNGVNGNHLNLRQIVERLLSEGIPAPQGGRVWHAEIVRRLLDSRACLGEFTFGEHTIVLPELAIIDQATWDAAQKRRKRNKELAKRNRKYEFLLAGHIKCKCDSAIIGNASRSYCKGKQYLYLQYVCPHQFRAVRRLLRACDAKPFSAQDADSKVWDWLAMLLSDSANLDKGLDEMAARRENELEPKKRRLAAVNELIEKAERKIKRLVSAFGDDDNADEVARAAVQAEVKATSAQREGLLSEREILEAELAQGTLDESARAAIKAKAGQIRQKLANPTFEQKRELLDLLDLRVKLSEDEKGRRLDCTCGLRIEPTPLSLCVTSLTTNVGV